MSIYTEEEAEEIEILLGLMEDKASELRAWRGKPQEPQARKELQEVIQKLNKALDRKTTSIIP